MTASLRFALLTLLALAKVPALAAQQAKVRLVNDPARRILRVAIGPVDIPVGAVPADGGHAHDPHAVHGGAIFPPITTVTIPVSGYLTGFSYEVVDGDGAQVPRELIHHLNLINPDRRELFLPISQRMLAVGKETGAQSMPGLLLGYPVPAGTRMVVSAMLHNPTDRAYRGVMVHVDLSYVPAGRPWPFLSVYPFQLDVAFPAGDKSFDLPPGRSEWSYEASPSMEGRIMAISGHLHEHAVSIKLKDVTTGEVLWEGFPIEDEQGNLVGVTLGRLYRTLGVKISPDHMYRVTVTYDNPTGDTLYAGGMGVVGGVFMPSTRRMWPWADTTHPLYVLDRKHYLQEVRGSFEEIASGEGALGQRRSTITRASRALGGR